MGWMLVTNNLVFTAVVFIFTDWEKIPDLESDGIENECSEDEVVGKDA